MQEYDRLTAPDVNIRDFAIQYFDSHSIVRVYLRDCPAGHWNLSFLFRFEVESTPRIACKTLYHNEKSCSHHLGLDVASVVAATQNLSPVLDSALCIPSGRCPGRPQTALAGAHVPFVRPGLAGDDGNVIVWFRIPVRSNDRRDFRSDVTRHRIRPSWGWSMARRRTAICSPG